MPKQRIIFALDYPNLDKAREGAQRIRDEVGVLKVGLELYTQAGLAAFQLVRETGLELFADLKLHDIPETVGRAVAAVAESGARFVTVHASGGAAMLSRSVQQAARAHHPLTVLAVTALTSLDESDLRTQGIPGPMSEHVKRLAELAWRAGVRGFVCSPAEVGDLRYHLGSEAILVTPGVRPAGADTQDQKRVATPGRAILDGANYIVVGRPIRDAADPASAARAIAAEVAAALGELTPRPSGCPAR